MGNYPLNDDGSFSYTQNYSAGTSAENVLYIKSARENKIRINSIKYRYSTPSSDGSGGGSTDEVVCLSGDTLITMFDGSTK